MRPVFVIHSIEPQSDQKVPPALLRCFNFFVHSLNLVNSFFHSLYRRNSDVKLPLNCSPGSPNGISRASNAVLRVKNRIGLVSPHRGTPRDSRGPGVGHSSGARRDRLIGEEHREHASPPRFCSRAFGAGINKRAPILSTGIFVYLLGPFRGSETLVAFILEVCSLRTRVPPLPGLGTCFERSDERRIEWPPWLSNY